MRIAICDDDLQEREQLLTQIKAWDPTRTAELFATGESLLKAAAEKPPFTVVFLDIYLVNESGVSIAKELRRTVPETEIAFTTTSSEFAVDAFALKAIHYLVKPISEEMVREVFSRVSEKQFDRRPTLSVKIGRNNFQINLDDIALLESIGHTTVIHKTDGSVLSAYTPLSSFLDSLGSSFLLLQRGVCVNMDFISNMRSDRCTLQSGQTIMLSRSSRTQIRSRYDNYIFSRLKGGIK